MPGFTHTDVTPAQSGLASLALPKRGKHLLPSFGLRVVSEGVLLEHF
jgi:hypothetical protein